LKNKIGTKEKFESSIDTIFKDLAALNCPLVSSGLFPDVGLPACPLNSANFGAEILCAIQSF
jgi:hypothetical protein